jgi:hypothetical protein
VTGVLALQLPELQELALILPNAIDRLNLEDALDLPISSAAILMWLLLLHLLTNV